jgi:hypothetical protein
LSSRLRLVGRKRKLGSGASGGKKRIATAPKEGLKE